MSLLAFDDALAQLLAAARPLAEIDEVPLLEADGRVLARPLVSALDVPPLDNSAMDGYALRSADVLAAGTRLAVSQRIPAGSVGHTLASGTAARIFTGAPVPAGADAVVMQERCEREGDVVVVNHVPRSGENVRRRGEDIAAGAEILAAGTRLDPQALGLAASIGVSPAPTFRRLRVALFFTGDELVDPGAPPPGRPKAGAFVDSEPRSGEHLLPPSEGGAGGAGHLLKPGAIYNSNRFVLRAALERLGCAVVDLGIVPDNLEATREALRRAAGMADLIVTSGGVSVGEEDYVKPAVEAEGRLAMWKLAIKPGKPLAYGRVQDADFIGLPGNPVSSFVTFVMLVRPFILKRMGMVDVLPRRIAMPAGFDWPRPDARREFLRVRLGRGVQAGRLELFPHQGSGVLTSTVWADGLVDNPPGQAIRAGDIVQYIPWGELLP